MTLELRISSILTNDGFTRGSFRKEFNNPNSIPTRRSVLRSSAHYQAKYRRSRSGYCNLRVCAASAESDTQEPPIVEEPKEWTALVANAEFMLNDVQNESLAEQLREKIRLYQEREKEVDFFLVPEPAWLDAMHPEKAKLVSRPCVAVVSSDPVWMRFMKTRLDQVLEIKLGVMKRAEALKSMSDLPEFQKPEVWRAPYGPYSPGWWKAFYPPRE